MKKKQVVGKEKCGKVETTGGCRLSVALFLGETLAAVEPPSPVAATCLIYDHLVNKYLSTTDRRGEKTVHRRSRSG